VIDGKGVASDALPVDLSDFLSVVSVICDAESHQ